MTGPSEDSTTPDSPTTDDADPTATADSAAKAEEADEKPKSKLAALREGRRVILIERDPEFAAIAAARCEAVTDGRDWRRPEQCALFGVAP